MNKRKERDRKMIVVRMMDKDGKKGVMQKKGALRGRKERIEDA